MKSRGYVLSRGVGVLGTPGDAGNAARFETPGRSAAPIAPGSAEYPWRWLLAWFAASPAGRPGSLAAALDASIALARGELRAYEPGCRLRILCEHGVVWITHDKPPIDIVLCAGEEILIDRRGRVVLSALEDARLRVSDGALSQPRAR